MTRGALIVNRVHFDGLDEHSLEQVQELLEPDSVSALARARRGNLADFDVLARRDRETIAQLSRELREPIRSSCRISTRTSTISPASRGWPSSLFS